MVLKGGDCMNIGRQKIFTYEREITYDNIISILQSIFPTHEINARDIKFLDDYEKGFQPLQRIKKYRADINIQSSDNVANEVTEFKTSFHWGNPITIVQRGDNAESNSEITNAITMLNTMYAAEEITKKTQHLGRNVEIGCLGYTYIDINMDEAGIQNGDSLFKIESINPQNAFIVYSSYYFDERPMIGVIHGKDSNGNMHITAFTNEFRFELIGYEHTDRSGEKNPIGRIPITEWFRSYDGMGCFERQIPEMDTLNILVSDFANDVDQNTQAIWHTNDVEFPTEKIKLEDGTEKEVVKKPKTNDWMQTFTSHDGKTPFVKPLAIDYDYTGMLNNILAKRALILQKCNVPQRNDNSGGSTGIAMDSATGWSSAEIQAQKQQQIMESCKMEELKIVLSAIKNSPYVPADSPLLKLKYTDLKPSIKRTKSFEMTTKVNFFATAVSHGIHGLHALKAMNAFEDVAQVYEDSKELIEKYQNNAFGEQKQIDDRLEQDYSDQIDNSPNIN